MNFNISFRSLDARRVSGTRGQVNINNNSTITSVTKADSRINVAFAFSCSYEPNIGLVRIEGDLTVEDKIENIEAAIDKWESSGRKKLPKDMAEKVHQAILSNCIIEASILARDVKLPPPIPMPNVNLNREGEQDTSYIR